LRCSCQWHKKLTEKTTAVLQIKQNSRCFFDALAKNKAPVLPGEIKNFGNKVTPDVE